MYKVVGLLVVVCVGYLLFFQDSSPDIIYFDGKEYGPGQLDYSNDSNSKIYKYFSKSVSNKDYISVLYPDSGTGSLSEWSNMFSKHFARQGFVFTENGQNKVGTNKTVKIYMMPSYNVGVVFMYILEDIKNSDHIDESQMFRRLDAIQID